MKSIWSKINFHQLIGRAHFPINKTNRNMINQEIDIPLVAREENQKQLKLTPTNSAKKAQSKGRNKRLKRQKLTIEIENEECNSKRTVSPVNDRIQIAIKRWIAITLRTTINDVEGFFLTIAPVIYQIFSRPFGIKLTILISPKQLLKR